MRHVDYADPVSGREEEDDMPAQDTPFVLRVAAGAGSPAGQEEHALVGYRIPYLPEGPSRPQLAALPEPEQVRDALASQARAVVSLAPFKQGAATLRYFVWPERATIEIVLLVRASAPAGKAAESATRMAQALTAQLAQMRIPTDPITGESPLREALAPAAQTAMVEIRQREDVVPLKLGAAYIVSPWQAAMTTWLSALGAFMSQPSPFVVSAHLEPTQLWPQERKGFAQAASVAGEAADLSYGGLSAQYHVTDPQAAMVAQLYTDYLLRLGDPLLAVVQVASRDVAVARTVAQVLGPEITGIVPVRSAEASRDLPCGYDVVVPQTGAEAAAAWHTMSMLQLAIWGASQAKPEQQRLRFLVDASAASGAFRFPLALRGSLPGISTSRPAGDDGGNSQIKRDIQGMPPRA
jgi:hypothetical protein